MDALKTKHGPLPLPAFLPDATRAVIRSTETDGLKAVNIKGFMVNVLHLSTQPGIGVIKKMGGIHTFMAWSGPVASDSGGFQIYSLIRENKKYGSASSKGFIYRPGGGKEKRLFTPEKSVRNQLALKSDVLFCLDQCTHPADDFDIQKGSVDRTVSWARECKEVFRQCTAEKNDRESKPLLFAVIQGGNNAALRRMCAEALLDLDFDGFGFGGWPVNDDGNLVDMVAQVAELIPPEYPRHALGIGKPENIISAWQAGYSLFDSSLPTRDARRGRLFVATGTINRSTLLGKDFYRYLYIEDKKYIRDNRPLDDTCSCPCCQKYSRAYLNHLFRIKDGLALHLATLHNLAFYARMMNALALTTERHGNSQKNQIIHSGFN